jgi:hypothetical protein
MVSPQRTLRYPYNKVQGPPIIVGWTMMVTLQIRHYSIRHYKHQIKTFNIVVKHSQNIYKEIVSSIQHHGWSSSGRENEMRNHSPTNIHKLWQYFHNETPFNSYQLPKDQSPTRCQYNYVRDDGQFERESIQESVMFAPFYFSWETQKLNYSITSLWLLAKWECWRWSIRLLIVIEMKY